MITKLTETIVNQLTCPDGKSRMECCDLSLPGLYVLVRAESDIKTYYLRYKNSLGKTAHQKIGRTTDIALAAARKKAKALKADILANGLDPKAVAKADTNALTLDDFWKDHYLPFATPRKRSIKRDEQIYRIQIQPTFGQSRLNQITRQQILSLAASVKDSGLSAASADHVSKLIRRLLTLAVEWEFLEKNPASRIQLFNEANEVEHYLDDEQLQRLLKVLQTDANRTVCLICQFLLATGCRLNEALTAQWSLIDRENGTWRVSAINSKSGKSRAVPLTAAALNVLDQIGTEGAFDYVFVNAKTGKHYTHIRHTWIRLRKKSGLPWLRLHDLRHTYASMLVNSGQSLYAVQQCLGHADSRVTQRYAHLSTKTLQDAANCASDKIMGAMRAAE
ncbi:MAG: tyrosine-type recombinase/integrase [Rhodospirillales bacterium]|nr:tyrosine-type recombinase/integrase [Rhodospirillales bacterium]